MSVPTDSEELQIVFVCTGNRFRSPLAAELFRRRVQGLPASVCSLGTLDLGGAPALTEAVANAARLGVDLSLHRTRCLLGVDLSGSDVVIGFEYMHVAAAVIDGHASTERTFTLPELVRLLDQSQVRSEGTDPAEHARLAIAHAGALRRDAGLRRGFPEIPDPLGAAPQVAAETAETIVAFTDRLVDGLFGSIPPRADAGS
jgi:protein-tyrosine-phosphatase